MDAATPYRRWLRAAGLLALVAGGCQTADAARTPVTRGQVPGAPVAPALPAPVAGAPVVPAAPVAGSPVTGQAVTASLSRPASEAPKAEAPPGNPQIKVIAYVGAGNIVTDQEVWEAVRQRAQAYLKAVDGPKGKSIIRDDQVEKVVYAEEFRNIIDRELILDEMATRLKKAGKTAVLDDIKEYAGKAADRHLREIKKRGGATDDDLRLMLQAQGLTKTVYRRQLERQMMAEEYVRSMMKEKGMSVGLAEVRGYFDAHPDEFSTPDRVKWLDLFVSFAQFPNPRAAYDHALAIQQQAAAGADFVALSKEHDQGIAGRQAGALAGVGTGQKRGEIEPKEVEPAVWALQVGQVSGLIEVPGGYHIVKVAERDVAGVRPFDDKVQADVRRKLMDLAYERERKRLVENLWRNGVVKVIQAP